MQQQKLSFFFFGFAKSNLITKLKLKSLILFLVFVGEKLMENCVSKFCEFCCCFFFGEKKAKLHKVENSCVDSITCRYAKKSSLLRIINGTECHFWILAFYWIFPRLLFFFFISQLLNYSLQQTFSEMQTILSNVDIASDTHRLRENPEGSRFSHTKKINIKYHYCVYSKQASILEYVRSLPWVTICHYYLCNIME